MGLVSSDAALCRAIAEQMRDAEGWHLAVFSSLEEALGVWSGALPPLLFWDAETAPAAKDFAAFFASRLEETRPAPLLLVLGSLPPDLESFGATAFFARPLRLGYLLSRLQFYQRLLRQAPDVSFTVGPYLFAPRARTLTPAKGGDPVKLTDKEASLLEFFCTADGPLSREEILASIWGYDERIDTHTLETHIYRLRRKLMDRAGANEDVFFTEDGGYRLNPSWRGA